MNEWKRYKIADIATLSNGINFDKSAYASGVKLIGVADFKDRIYPDYSLLQEVASNIVRSGDYLEKGDIVFVRSNGNKELVGRCMMINDDIPVTYSGFCINLRLNDKKKFNPIYFNYLFKTRQFRKSMTGTAVGANIQNLSQSRLGDCEVNVPDVETQNNIATILSRYDSLIENYQKQIKLLEEAAQRLYKEWFVDLHFPGYENTKIVDGVPEGWNRGVLNDIAYESGKKVDKKNRDYYDYYLPIDCLPKHSLTYLSPTDITLAESSLVSFEENDIIFGAMRPYFHKVCFAQSKGLTRTTCFVLNSNQKEYREFLLMLLFEESTVKHATSISVGTTMPYTRWKEFKSMEIVIPTKEIAIAFGKNVSRITKVLKKYSSQIRLLTEARDRLLPKLMSGK